MLGEDEHKIQMTAGQMLLAGFNGLFTKLETEIDSLLSAVEHVDSEFEDGVDVYKEVEELMVGTCEVYGVVEGDVMACVVWCGVACDKVWCVVWYDGCGVVWCDIALYNPRHEVKGRSKGRWS